jgi:glutathione S-transferase
MKIYSSPASPFGRKVRIAALELGLALEVEDVATATHPELPLANPLGKIPALIRADGPPIYDSSVICAYLDALSGGRLIPAAGEARWRALTLEALADGLCDAAVARRTEAARAGGDAHADLLAKYAKVMGRSLGALEAQVDDFSGAGVGEIATACALGYLDYRFADEPWRERFPRLAAWFSVAEKRASFTQTAPG